jgi:GNAT superfamily N-acetyltransferase
VEVQPASQLGVPALAELFNACYADYLVDLNLDEAAFRQHLDSNDIDLGGSRIAIDAAPVAIALIARRESSGWVGGMGTIRSHRRRGIGERVLTVALEEAGERGCEAVWLEVIDRNEAAVELYYKLGFEHVRDLIVWSMPAPGGGVTPHRAVPPDEAHAWIVRHRDSREPWQRADESLAKMVARRSTLRGLVIDHGDGVTAAAVFDDLPGLVTVTQIAAVGEKALAEAMVAATGGDRPLRLSNAPADGAASRALESLGAAPVVRQHEMVRRPR